MEGYVQELPSCFSTLSTSSCKGSSSSSWLTASRFFQERHLYDRSTRCSTTSTTNPNINMHDDERLFDYITPWKVNARRPLLLSMLLPSCCTSVIQLPPRLHHDHGLLGGSRLAALLLTVVRRTNHPIKLLRQFSRDVIFPSALVAS